MHQIKPSPTPPHDLCSLNRPIEDSSIRYSGYKSMKHPQNPTSSFPLAWDSSRLSGLLSDSGNNINSLSPSGHLFLYLHSFYFFVCGRKPPKSQSALQHLLSLQQKTHQIAEEEISLKENPQITERRNLFGRKPLNHRKKKKV